MARLEEPKQPSEKPPKTGIVSRFTPKKPKYQGPLKDENAHDDERIPG